MYRSYGGGIQWHRTPWVLCDTRAHHRVLLMALHGSWHSLVYADLLHLPDLPNPSNRNPSGHCYAGTTICQNIHGYHVSPLIWQLLVHSTRLLLSHSLPRILDALERDSSDNQRLDLPGYPMSLGYLGRNHLRQWQALHSSTRTSGEKVPHKTH